MQVTQQALHMCRAEFFPLVVQPQPQTLVSGQNHQCHWVVRPSAALAAKQMKSSQGQFELLERVVLKDDNALEERLSSRYLAPSLNLGQGAVLILPAPDLLLLQLPKPFANSLLRHHLQPDRQRVDEQPQHLIDS